jgi:hypothetical protein
LNPVSCSSLKPLKTPLPIPEESNDKLFTNEKTGMLITQPGLVLPYIFEEELGLKLSLIDLLKHIQEFSLSGMT